MVLHPKAGPPITLKTNVLALSRSHISKEPVPADVSVTRGKHAYQYTSVYRRTPPGPNDMLYETE